MTPILRTDRLILAPYRPEDEEVFVALLGDEEVCRWMGQDRVPEEQIRAIFQAILNEIYAKNMFDVWAVWSEGVYVGHAEIKKTGNVDGYEMIAALVKESRGRGWAMNWYAVCCTTPLTPCSSTRSTAWWAPKMPPVWRWAKSWDSPMSATSSRTTAR